MVSIFPFATLKLNYIVGSVNTSDPFTGFPYLSSPCVPGLPPYYSSDPIPFSTNPAAGASHPFSPLFSLSPNPLPAGLLNQSPEAAGGINSGIEAIPFVPQSPPPDQNQMAAYLSASPPLMSSIQYFTGNCNFVKSQI